MAPNLISIFQNYDFSGEACPTISMLWILIVLHTKRSVYRKSPKYSYTPIAVAFHTFKVVHATQKDLPNQYETASSTPAVLLTLNLTTHTCNNYTIQHISENTSMYARNIEDVNMYIKCMLYTFACFILAWHLTWHIHCVHK